MATWLTQCSEHHLVLLTRRNCRKTSGTSGATGGDSLGKPLCRACHLDRTESGWCWNSCSLDIRAQLLPRTRASCTRIERNSFVGTTPRTGTENNKNANSSAFRSSSSIKHRRRTTTECYRSVHKKPTREQLRNQLSVRPPRLLSVCGHQDRNVCPPASIVQTLTLRCRWTGAAVENGHRFGHQH